jgi:bacteriorhodopsin
MSVTKVKQGMFWRLLVGTLVFVIAEFLGAAGYMSKTLGFIVGVVGWLYILGELYVGEAGRANARCGNEKIQMAFFANRLILTIGWAIYPIGYFIEHLGGGIDINSVNVVYNLSDFLNKIVFGMIIYKAATEDTRING